MPKRVPYWNPGRPHGGPSRREQAEKKLERGRFYAGVTWRRLREAFLASNPLCATCLNEGREVIATVVHHREERLSSPDAAMDWDNLESLCAPCHSKLHARKGRGHVGAQGVADR